MRKQINKKQKNRNIKRIESLKIKKDKTRITIKTVSVIVVHFSFYLSGLS